MLSARARNAIFLVVAVALAALLASRSARSDCSNGATSEGYGDCQKYPACQCVPKIITCPNGGWWTQYTVVLPCAGPSPGPAPTASGGPSSSSQPPSQECDMMNKWLKEEQNFLSGYEDPTLVQQGTEDGWSMGRYDIEVWRSAHAGDPVPASGDKVMSTNVYDCELQDEGPGCAWLISQHLPQAACQIAKDHEAVHHAQCVAGQQNYQPVNIYDLGAKSQREIAAHRNTVSEITNWIHNNCP